MFIHLLNSGMQLPPLKRGAALVFIAEYLYAAQECDPGSVPNKYCGLAGAGANKR